MVMRIGIAVVVLAVACDKGKKATPAPNAGSAGSSSLIGSAAIPDAQPAQDAATDATSDASGDASSASGIVISRAGVGALGTYEWWKSSDDENVIKIQNALAALGTISVGLDVMDVPGEVEREEGYYSVKRADTELVQVLRASGPPDGEAPAVVIVWTPDIPTSDGTKVGDTLGSVLAKHADLACTHSQGNLIAEMVAADLVCSSPSEREIRYLVAVKGKRLKDGPVPPSTIETNAVVGIAHQP